MTIPDPLYRNRQEVWCSLPYEGEFKTLPCLVCAVHVTIPAKGSISFSYKLAHRDENGDWQYSLFVQQDEIFATEKDCDFYTITFRKRHDDNNGLSSGEALCGLGEDADRPPENG